VFLIFILEQLLTHNFRENFNEITMHIILSLTYYRFMQNNDKPKEEDKRMKQVEKQLQLIKTRNSNQDNRMAAVERNLTEISEILKTAVLQNNSSSLEATQFKIDILPGLPIGPLATLQYRKINARNMDASIMRHAFDPISMNSHRYIEN